MENQNLSAPLKGVTVLDFTRAVAGPFCTMMLGDLGARVIKIEEPEEGDESRFWGPPFAAGESAYFLALNRNKESVELDLKSEHDRELLRKIARASDVVVQNFRPGVPQRLSVDYETLRASNRGLIYASVSGFGLSGPDSYRPGYDLIVQAMSGMMLANAVDGKPVKACFPIADILAGQFVCNGILAALVEKAKTGLGTHVEVSLLESLMSAMSYQTTAALMTGQAGSNLSAVVPYQLFTCADTAIAVACSNDRIWARFAEALGHAEWAEDPRFRRNEQRHKNREVLLDAINDVTRTEPAGHWLEVLDRAGVPCGPLLQVPDAMEYRQVAARGSVVTMPHPLAGPVRVVANPIRYAGRETEYRTPPMLGQDTEAVRAEFARE